MARKKKKDTEGKILTNNAIFDAKAQPKIAEPESEENEIDAIKAVHRYIG